jgi:Glycosyl hydrolase family 65 central catalytic domain
MAMFLLGSNFSLEEKRRNFDYYDPLTTRDSSLSSCVQSIVATEVGYKAKAMEYFLEAVLVDLGDIGGNVIDGVHIASASGVWMDSSTASAACVTTTANSTSTRGSPLYGRAYASHSPGANGISRSTWAPARCATGCWEGRPSPSRTRASPLSWHRVRPWSRNPASVVSSRR